MFLQACMTKQAKTGKAEDPPRALVIRRLCAVCGVAGARMRIDAGIAKYAAAKLANSTLEFSAMAVSARTFVVRGVNTAPAKRGRADTAMRKVFECLVSAPAGAVVLGPAFGAVQFVFLIRTTAVRRLATLAETRAFMPRHAIRTVETEAGLTKNAGLATAAVAEAGVKDALRTIKLPAVHARLIGLVILAFRTFAFRTVLLHAFGAYHLLAQPTVVLEWLVVGRTFARMVLQTAEAEGQIASVADAARGHLLALASWEASFCGLEDDVGHE